MCNACVFVSHSESWFLCPGLICVFHPSCNFATWSMEDDHVCILHWYSLNVFVLGFFVYDGQLVEGNSVSVAHTYLVSQLIVGPSFCVCEVLCVSLISNSRMCLLQFVILSLLMLINKSSLHVCFISQDISCFFHSKFSAKDFWYVFVFRMTFSCH